MLSLEPHIARHSLILNNFTRHLQNNRNELANLEVVDHVSTVNRLLVGRNMHQSIVVHQSRMMALPPSSITVQGLWVLYHVLPSSSHHLSCDDSHSSSDIKVLSGDR